VDKVEEPTVPGYVAALQVEDTGGEPVADKVEPADDDDEEILKKLSRTKWVAVPMWTKLGISEEEVERLVTAGKVRRHPKTPSTVGVVK
jgi:hypothetical protein